MGREYAFFVVLPTHSRLKPSQGVFPCDLGYESCYQKTRLPGLPNGLKCVILRYRLVTITHGLEAQAY